MKTRVDAELREQAARLRFRFACEDCAHFSEDRQRCSLGYRASPRRADLERPPATTTAPLPVVELCKTYELA